MTQPSHPDEIKSPAVLSAGRVRLAETLPSLMVWPVRLPADECVRLLTADVDDEDAFLMVEACEAARAAAREAVVRILAGELRTYARPVGGGRPIELDPDHWELDEPLWRFCKGRMNLEDWSRAEAEPTHILLVSDEDLRGLAPQRSMEAPPVRPEAADLDAEHARMTGAVQDMVGSDRASGLSMLRLTDVMARTGKSRSAIYEAIREADFPKQVLTGARTVAWYEHEVEAWLMTRPRRRSA